VKPVAFHPAAQAEVEEAAARYEAQRDGLAQEFRSEFEAALRRIVQNPQMYGGRTRRVPRLLTEAVPLHDLLHRSRRSALAGRGGASESSAGLLGAEAAGMRAGAKPNPTVEQTGGA
jgi:plasmid stabilization system protein ParE